MRKQKVAPLPIIDLGGSVKVIDISVCPPIWKKIADCFPASKEKAKRIIAEHGLNGAWLFDDCGYKEYVSLDTVPRKSVKKRKRKIIAWEISELRAERRY